MRWQQLWLDGAHPSIVRAFTLGGSRCISTSRDDITMRLYSSRTTNCPFAALSLRSCKGLDKRTACTASETRVDDSTRMGMECAGRNRRPLGTCPGPAPPKRVTLPGSLLGSTCCTCTCDASAQPSHSQPRANKFRKQAGKASARDAMHEAEYICTGTGLFALAHLFRNDIDSMQVACQGGVEGHVDADDHSLCSELSHVACASQASGVVNAHNVDTAM